MRYENVSSKEELDFMIKKYKEEGYEIEWQIETIVKMKKSEFSNGVFLLLLLFFIIGGLIYLALKGGKEDIIVISMDEKPSLPDNEEMNTDEKNYDKEETQYKINSFSSWIMFSIILGIILFFIKFFIL